MKYESPTSLSSKAMDMMDKLKFLEIRSNFKAKVTWSKYGTSMA